MSATLRTVKDVQSIQDLLSEYMEHRNVLDKIDEVTAEFRNEIEVEVQGTRILISECDVIGILKDRCSAICAGLENKGLKMALDAPEPLASIRRQQDKIAIEPQP